MKICMLATCHLVEDARLFQKEAVTLSKQHEITIIGRGEDKKQYKKQGITLKPIPGDLNAKNYFPRFLQILIKGFQTKPDVYHCHEPGSLLIGVALSKINGAKVVYDVHENWGSVTSTASVVFQKIKPLVEPYVILLENLLVPHADYVISVSESVQGRLLAHNKNHCIIYNYPIVESEEHEKNKTTYDCVYTGNVYKNRGSDILTSVALNDKKIKYNIIGDTDIENIENINLTKWIPYDLMKEEMKKSKIGLVLFQPNVYNNFIGLPQKLFEYMMLGIPVIAPDYPEIRNIVNKAECGILVDVTDHNKILDSIQYLLSNPDMLDKMGSNGYRYVVEHTNWKKEENKLLNVYEELKT